MSKKVNPKAVYEKLLQRLADIVSEAENELSETKK